MFGKKKRIQELEAENAKLKAENATLRSVEYDLRIDVEGLKAEKAELKESLETENAKLKDENSDLKAKLAKRDESPSYAQIVDEWLNGEENANGQ